MNSKEMKYNSGLIFGGILFILTCIIRIVPCDHDRPRYTLPDKPPLKVNLTTENDWIEKSLKRHNYYRSLHNLRPLKLNRTLSEMSQSWANYLLKRGAKSVNEIGDVTFFEHNYDMMKEHSVGENLYYMAGCYDKLSPGLAVSLWYNEIKNYDFNLGSGKFSDSLYGHFTQLMWNSSREMGIAYASRKLGNNQTLTFITGYYYPRGNMLMDWTDNPNHLFVQNVPPADVSVFSEENYIADLIKKNGLSLGNITTPGSWIAAAVAKHNDYRMEFGVGEILISEELCETSQAWADLLLKTALDEFNRNQMVLYRKNANRIFGENVMYFISNTDDIDASIPLFMWFGEKKFYDFSKRSTNLTMSKTAKTHHFEQIVWKSTTHMCMVIASGVAENGQYLTFTVAQYYPSGQGEKTLQEKVANINMEIGKKKA